MYLFLGEIFIMQFNDDVVLEVIQKFVQNNELFTALDVSNEVKKSFPSARHRVVRDIVRFNFITHIEPHNYAKTPITVNLEDNTTAEAMLYHPLEHSWDLDTKYDAQKRAQTSTQIAVNNSLPAMFSDQMASVLSVDMLKSTLNSAENVTKSLDTVKNIDTTFKNIDTTLSVTKSLDTVKDPFTTALNNNARQLWSSLFDNKPSLFPRK